MSSGKPSKKELFESLAETREIFHQDASVILKPCAICGEKRGRRLYMQAHFPVVRCGKCSLIYADEHFDDQQLRRFYTGDYYERAYVCHPPEIDKKIADDYVSAFKLVADHRPEGGRLLDFGSARGTFLAELRSRGYEESWRLQGIDINPDEVAMGRDAGLDITCGTIESAALPPETFDVVTAFSVLEHLQDPLEELTRIRRILVSGGHLVAIIPAGNCLIVRLGILAHKVFGERVRAFTDNVFHEEHLYYFTPRTLRRALAQTGFEALRIFGQPSYLETHPPTALVALGALGLRFTSWALRMPTMLGVVARKI